MSTKDQAIVQQAPQPKGKKKFTRPTVAIRHQKVLDNLVENGGKLTQAIRDADYSPAVVSNPSKITESKTWRELVDEKLSDDKLSSKHEALLNATGLDHMTFPLGPRTSKEKEKYVAEKMAKAVAAGRSVDDIDKDVLSDEEIKELLAEVGCTLRRMVHGETARHAYFWAPDNKTQKDTLELAYKIKGKLVPDPGEKGGGNTYNILFAGDTQQEIKAFEEKLKAKLIGHVEPIQASVESIQSPAEKNSGGEEGGHAARDDGGNGEAPR